MYRRAGHFPIVHPPAVGAGVLAGTAMICIDYQPSASYRTARSELHKRFADSSARCSASESSAVVGGQWLRAIG
jgi:hypothetical protein